ncbi:MAG: HNH endonuclease [Spirochaetes bacterium]|nr:HNH endonuclease [Spirochaetota bacterium]
MKEGQRAWTRDELILAINLYCKLPFGKLDQRTPEVKQLAKLIDRTPGSVSFKLNNFASLDPSLQARGIKGAQNTSKLDKIVWDEFYNNWSDLPFESEKRKATLLKTSVEKINEIDEANLPTGKERERVVKVRVNQRFFRDMIMAAYNDTCCITGLRNRELLVAGHIQPWGVDEGNRLNPRNGLALNYLHDKAFEIGLITITEKYTVKVSKALKKNLEKPNVNLLSRYEGRKIHLPRRFLPDIEFLRNHQRERFQG